MTDQLILGGFIFQNFDFSVPTRIPFGGQQSMIVHKLPGGTRVIDTLGPDEDDITWSGFFFASSALHQCQQLDAMRASGQRVTLTYGGMSRQVVIKRFKPNIRRYPHWVEYEITCTVSDLPSYAASAPVAIGYLVSADLITAITASTQ
jgi:hypothetical protein